MPSLRLTDGAIFYVLRTPAGLRHTLLVKAPPKEPENKEA